jgi:hypothetical protein
MVHFSLGTGWAVDELRHSRMIEDLLNSRRTLDQDRFFADRQRFGMANFDSGAARQLNGEWFERFSPQEDPKHMMKLAPFHQPIVHCDSLCVRGEKASAKPADSRSLFRLTWQKGPAETEDRRL